MKKYIRAFIVVMIMTAVMTFAACGKNEAADAPASDQPAIGDTSSAATDPQQDYIEVSREGEVSQIPVDIVRGQAAAYTIAMDPEYFGYTCYEGIDTYSYNEWDGERSVYYCVYPNYDMSPEKLADGIVFQYSNRYADCHTESVKIGDYDALAVYLDGENEASDYNRHFFVIECDGGSIVIETQFCFEMYEGLYAIMRQCFNTFTMLETE